MSFCAEVKVRLWLILLLLTQLLPASAKPTVLWETRCEDARLVWLSPRGNLVVLGDSHKLQIREARTGRILTTLAGGKQASFNSDGTRLAVLMSGQPGIRVFTLPPQGPPRPLWSAQAKPSSEDTLQFSGDGSCVGWCDSKAIKLWRAADGQALPGPTPPQIDNFLGMRFAHRGHRLLAWQDKQALVWDALTGKGTWFPLEGDTMHTPQVGEHGSLVVAHNDRKIKIVRIEADQPRTLAGFSLEKPLRIQAVQVTPRGELMVQYLKPQNVEGGNVFSRLYTQGGLALAKAHPQGGAWPSDLEGSSPPPLADGDSWLVANVNDLDCRGKVLAHPSRVDQVKLLGTDRIASVTRGGQLLLWSRSGKLHAQLALDAAWGETCLWVAPDLVAVRCRSSRLKILKP